MVSTGRGSTGRAMMLLPRRAQWLDLQQRALSISIPRPVKVRRAEHDLQIASQVQLIRGTSHGGIFCLRVSSWEGGAWHVSCRRGIFQNMVADIHRHAQVTPGGHCKAVQLLLGMQDNRHRPVYMSCECQVASMAAGLRACVRKLDVNCRATRPACWVAPTAYLRNAVYALGTELKRRGLAPAQRDGGSAVTSQSSTITNFRYETEQSNQMNCHKAVHYWQMEL